MSTPGQLTLTHEQWLAEFDRRAGKSPKAVRFVCPACGHVQTGNDFLEAGVSRETMHSLIAFSCIGRVLPAARDAFGKGDGPCNYAGGGLFRIAPIRVTFDDGRELYAFDFADDPLCGEPASASVADGGAES